MAYPYKVMESGDTSNSLLPPCAFAAPFLFEYQGNLYCAVTRFTGSDERMAMLKSTDNGVTWSNMDKANEPYNASSDYTSSESFHCQVDGSDFLCSYIDDRDDIGPPLAARLVVKRFDLSTDTWDSFATLIADNGPLPGGRPGITQMTTWQVIRLSDGRLFCVFSEPYTVSGATFVRARYSVYSAGSWSALATWQEEQASPKASDVYPAGAYLLDGDNVAVLTYANEQTWTQTGVWLKIWKPNNTVTDFVWLGDHPQSENEVGLAQVYTVSGQQYLSVPYGNWYLHTTTGALDARLAIVTIAITGSSFGSMRSDVILDAWLANVDWYQITTEVRAPLAAFIHQSDADYVVFAEELSFTDFRASVVCNKGRAWTSPSVIYDFSGKSGTVTGILRQNGNIGAAYFSTANNAPYYYEFTPSCAASPCGTNQANKYYII